MESYEHGELMKDESHRRFQRIVKTWIGCLGSFTLSMIGGLILTWWELNYHPTNAQLWMVPLGLIVFITPVIVWFALFVSDFCNTAQPSSDTTVWIIPPPEKPFHDTER